MADSLTEQIMASLGLKMPRAPEVSPEQEGLYREIAAREQAKRPQWKKTISAGIEGAGNFLKGLGLSDPITDTPKNWPEFGGMVIGAAGLPFSPKGIKGLYSRVKRVAEGLPSAVHPNKLAAILKNRASQEEVQWRGIDRLLQGKGDTPVKKREFVEHLEQNPLDVKVKEYGAPDLNKWSVRRGQPPGDYHVAEHPQAGVFNAGRTEQDALDWIQQEGPKRVQDTVYNNYQMPGAQNYRETLIQLVPPSNKPGSSGGMTPAEQFEFAPKSGADLFRGQHWEDPNVLVHVRHNERDLRNTPDLTTKVERERGPAPQSNYIGTILGNGEPIASVYPRRTPGPGVVPEMRGEADALLHQIKQQLPPPDRGRMLENVQSDWHQRGAHSGYANLSDAPAGMAADVAIHDARNALDAQNQRIINMLNQGTMPAFRSEPDWDVEQVAEELGQHLNRAMRDFPVAEDLYNQHNQARVALDNANDAAIRSAGNAVPDAPFKDSWPELALKQQLLDVADRPDLEWLGIAPQSELAARGEQISPEFQDVQLPNTLEKLIKPFGGSVKQTPIMAGPQPFFNPQTSYDNPTGEQSHTEVWRYLTGDDGAPTPVASVWPKTSDTSAYNPDKDSGKLMELLQRARPELLQSEPVKAFIARLTPEMKAQIKEKGFPLLTLLAMLQAQQQEN